MAAITANVYATRDYPFLMEDLQDQFDTMMDELPQSDDEQMRQLLPRMTRNLQEQIKTVRVLFVSGHCTPLLQCIL